MTFDISWMEEEYKNKKWCYRCKRWLDRTPENFTSDKSRPDGLNNICRKCRKFIKR
jgi:hypothetical protein